MKNLKHLEVPSHYDHLSNYSKLQKEKAEKVLRDAKALEKAKLDNGWHYVQGENRSMVLRKI